jgi:predicted RNA-binding Zn ribbon-like protein
MPGRNRCKLILVVTTLLLVGGDPALDLVNTTGDARVSDPLADYGEFVAWAARAGVIDEPTAGRLASLGGERADEAAAALSRARDLRGAVDAVFRPLAVGSEPPPDALARVVADGAAAVERARLVPAGDGFAYTWEGDDLARPLWPLAAAAVDLLRSGPLDRLKACDGCPWLFIDTSRNRSRRWCSMEVCGAHSKMRRYRALLSTEGR